MSPREDHDMNTKPAAKAAGGTVAASSSTMAANGQKRGKRDREYDDVHDESPSLSGLGEDLMCGVCLEVMVHPRTISPCGHTFCGSCIPSSSPSDFSGAVTAASSFRSGQFPSAPSAATLCPTCRGNILSHLPARTLESVIEKVVHLPRVISDDDRQHYEQRVKSTPRPKEAPAPTYHMPAAAFASSSSSSSAAARSSSSSRRTARRSASSNRAARRVARGTCITGGSAAVPSSRTFPQSGRVVTAPAPAPSQPQPQPQPRALSSSSTTQTNRTQGTAAEPICID